MDNSLIRRQAAIDAVNNAFDRETLLTGFVRSIAVRAIRDMPTAQPDRMRGKWTPHREKSREYIGATLVYITYDYWFCDTCGYRVEDGQPLYNFCPHCGIDMRGT